MKIFFVITLFVFGSLPLASKPITDVPYSKSKNPKNNLNLYIPKNKGFPTFIFVHGGGWRVGDKTWYSWIGESLKNKGIGVVVINYRLTPEVSHPENAMDVANAAKWVFANIEGYGGDKKRIFIGGHSAGAHLSSLVVCNKEFDLDNKVRGMVLISGVYSINTFVHLGGFNKTFRDDRETASPILYVRKGLPNTVIFYASKDFPTLGKQARKFGEAMCAKDNKCQIIKIPKVSHNNIIDQIFSDSGSYFNYIVDFLNK
jgi:acetyl esterase/lipase